jgi:hypothetical protein
MTLIERLMLELRRLVEQGHSPVYIFPPYNPECPCYKFEDVAREFYELWRLAIGHTQSTYVRRLNVGVGGSEIRYFTPH